MFLIIYFFFFFNDTATTEIYTLSLHDALPISFRKPYRRGNHQGQGANGTVDLKRVWGYWRQDDAVCSRQRDRQFPVSFRDRKSTRLNSSHSSISYAVFCLKKKKKNTYIIIH